MSLTTKTLIHLLTLLLWLSLSPANAGWLEAIPSREQSRELRLEDLQQKQHDLQDYRGKVVLVNFWASWCTPCLKEMPSMQRLQTKLTDRPFQLLAVNAGESAHKAKTSSQSHGPDLLILLDPKMKAYNAWGAKVFPSSYLLDTRGRIRYLVQGPMEWDDESVMAAIEELLTEDHPGDKQPTQ